MSLTIEAVGARLYVSGNSYPVKDRLKSIGCHWDGDRKQWWIGTQKREALESVVSGNGGAEAVEETAESRSAKPCYGKAQYKGRTYFIIGRSERTQKLQLTVLDCSIAFWAPMADCTIVKHYEGRTDYRTGRVEYQTVGGIRRFVAREKATPAGSGNSNGEMKQCWECGCSFTRADARRNGGDWQEGHCGC